MDDLQLDNLKIGDEVVSITPKGNSYEYGGIRYVTEFVESRNGWRYSAFKNGERKNCGFFPIHGGCKMFMSNNPNPDYYFSANPKHIKAARRQHEKKAKILAQKDAKEKAKFNEFKTKLDALLREYGANIIPIQTNGDDQGVEIALHISIGRTAINVHEL